MTQCLIDFFKKQDVEYIEGFKISKYSSIGIGGKSDFAVIPDNESKLKNVVDFLKEYNLKFKVVGKMSNILFCGERYDGVLVLTNKLSGYYVAENVVTAQCGVAFSRMLQELASLNLGIYEELYGIPGSVGGMVFGNAGAYGKCISDCLVSAKLYLPKKNKTVILDSSEMKFSYRNSIMKEYESILISASFALRECDEKFLRDRMKQVIFKRKATQPYGQKSLGSIFKRCGEIPISKLIDELGFKGYSVGGAVVSDKHAGFILNSGGADSDDVITLINLIKNRIYASYGIIAEEEIELL